ncbi:MAG: toxin glutamine deamidase domain-containing protein [Nitriliruptorales bacterium]
MTEADAAGHTTYYDYDAGDRVIRVTDPAGAETSFAYDPVGRLIEATDALGATTRYEWSPAGRLRSVTSPLGHATRYEYDATGQTVAVLDPTGARRSVDRDVSGRVVAATSPNGERVEWDYDAAGRVVSSRGADGAVTRFGYDPAGRLAEIVDPTGAAVRYAYDPTGRLVQAVDPLGGATSFSYDRAGLLRTTVDPLGGEQRLDYDSVGRMVAFTDQAGNQRRLRLDQAGRVFGQVDGAGNQVRFWRDEAGRVTGWGPQDLPEPLVRLELDPVGRPVRFSEPDRMTSLSWDGLGRLVGRQSEGLALGWRYDADGRQTAVVHPDGSETTYAYDAAGRLTALAHPVAGQARIERDREGLPVRFDGPGIRRSWQRRHGRTVRFTQQMPDTSVRVGFEHDAAGRVVAENGPQGRTSYRYDPAGQLVGMHTPEGGAWSWAYDAGGRRVRESGPPGERRFRYDPAGRLLEVESEGDTVHLAYDGAGRRVGESSRDGEVAYTWDSLGRLSSIRGTRGGRVTETNLRTDALGDLVAVDDTTLVWDRSRGLPVPRRIGAADIVGVWDPLAVVTSGGSSWVATDSRGSIGDAPDVWGGGSGIDAVAAAKVDLGYRGELNVAGLVWLRNRAYDPATAAFLSPDPLPPVLGSPTVANPYHYAFNDPLGYVDPLGLQPLTDAQLAQMREAADRPIWDTAAESFSELVQDPGRWVSEHGDELLAAGVVVAGTIMIATGVGAPIGAGLLIGAGISMGAQVALTGEVDARQVWISGLAGGAGAGAGVLTAGRSLATQVAVGAGTDAASSTLGQLIITGHVNPTAVIADTIAGGVSSSIGARLRPSSTTSVDELVAGHSIRDVNPGYPSPGRKMNCVNCAVATDATLAGRPASALPGSPTPIAALEEHFGGTFKAVASPSEVSASLHEAGPGARGIIFGYRSTGVGHVFNAVNQRGTVRFLDGQIGGPASLEGYDALYFLRTN